jgi:hypothetical protein
LVRNAARPTTSLIAVPSSPPQGAAHERVVPRPPSPATVRPISAEAYSLRVTVDAGFKKELDE